MTKNNAEHRKSLIQRVDEHEKLFALIIDRMNNNVDPELKMLAGAVQKNKDDIEGINGWRNRSLWEKVKEALPW